MIFLPGTTGLRHERRQPAGCRSGRIVYSRSMSKDHRLVYSTDPEVNRRCPRCRELIVECSCRPEADVTSSGKTATLRLEKKGRGGKSVTVADKLPANRELLSSLTTLLKKRCGSGGTYRVDDGCGVIEIQGDKRDEVRKVLAAEGFRVKG